MTLRTSQYLFNHFIGRSYRPEPLWKHSSVCSFVFKKNTIQQLSKIHAVWSDYSLIYKILFLKKNKLLIAINEFQNVRLISKFFLIDWQP